MGGSCLLIGGSSMLAGDLAPQLERAGLTVSSTFCSRRAHSNGESFTLDIADSSAVTAAFQRLNPELVINCAAYTNVDKAESDYPGAIALNGLGPKYLAANCAEFGAKLVHISTDYVFNGPDRVNLAAFSAIAKPFSEDDKTTPISVYGWSKFLGEEFIRSSLLESQYLILRTSWLHGVHGNNFVDTILNAAQKNSELKVVADQFGGPTWTGWLAAMIIELVNKKASGLFNVASTGQASRYEQAKLIVKLAGLNTVIKPQSSAETERPAPRPSYSVLKVKKLEEFLGRSAISWEDGIREHLQLRGVI